MKVRYMTTAVFSEFKEHLILEERSTATVEKYIRDVKAFSAFVYGAEVTKEVVIEYKKHLQENYAVRSVNSMLASINSLFVFLGWHELKVKSIKLQQQIFCPEEKELTKAEYARLCRTAEEKRNERLNLILQTICGTGIRVSELQYRYCQVFFANSSLQNEIPRRYPGGGAATLRLIADKHMPEAESRAVSDSLSRPLTPSAADAI